MNNGPSLSRDRSPVTLWVFCAVFNGNTTILNIITICLKFHALQEPFNHSIQIRCVEASIVACKTVIGQ